MCYSVTGVNFALHPYAPYVRTRGMLIRLTKTQYETLRTWGELQGVQSPDNAAGLLLDVLRESFVPADRAINQPQSSPRGWNGARVYSAHVKIPPHSRSPKTRALWAWGSQRGERNISTSFRTLVTILGETWDPEATIDQNIVNFSEAIAGQLAA